MKLIDGEKLIEDLRRYKHEVISVDGLEGIISLMPSAEPEIIRCRDCEHWRRQINYQGTPLSWGFCESEDMWKSLYGETYEVAHIDTDDEHFCGYAERKSDE